jgi:predicted RNA-binding protein Jag
MGTSGDSFSGRSLDEALSEACAGLGARLGELRYEVSETGQERGVVVRAEVDPLAVVGLFLSEAFAAGELAVKVELKDGGEVIDGELSGDDLRVLTGGGGRGLDALQYLCNRALRRRLEEHPPVHLDGRGFKARRALQLQEKAMAAAEEALERRGPVVLPPMTPAARREVHLALADDPTVETESDGEGFVKRVVVRPRRRR